VELDLHRNNIRNNTNLEKRNYSEFVNTSDKKPKQISSGAKLLAAKKRSEKDKNLKQELEARLKSFSQNNDPWLEHKL